MWISPLKIVKSSNFKARALARALKFEDLTIEMIDCDDRFYFSNDFMTKAVSFFSGHLEKLCSFRGTSSGKVAFFNDVIMGEIGRRQNVQRHNCISANK